MTLKVDAKLDPVNLRDDVRRGARYRRALEFYGDASTGGECSPLVQGDPLNFTGYTSLQIPARIVGTNEAIVMSAVFEARGDGTTTPPRIRFECSSTELEEAFDEGAVQAFEFTIFGIATGIRDEIVSGRVRVIDGGYGGIR